MSSRQEPAPSVTTAAEVAQAAVPEGASQFSAKFELAGKVNLAAAQAVSPKQEMLAFELAWKTNGAASQDAFPEQEMFALELAWKVNDAELQVSSPKQ